MELFKLFGSIFVDNKEAEKSISSTDKKAEGLGKRLGSGIATAAKWGAGIAVAAAAGGAALFGMATKTAETTDRIDKLSQKIGLSRQGFQEWEFILSQSGTDIEKMQAGLKTLNARMDEAASGTGKGAEQFSRLGVSVTDSTGALRSQEEVFEDTVRALQEMPDGAEKARIATEMFGKAGQELMPLLNGAAGSVDAMKQQAHELGLVIGDEAIDAGVQFTDTMDQLKRSFSAVTTNVGAAVMPMFQQFAQWITNHMPQIQKVIKTVFGVIETVVKVAVEVIKILINTFSSFFKSTEDSGKGFQKYFETFSNWFKEIFALIVEIVKAALAAIKKFWADHGEQIMAIVKPFVEAIKGALKMGMDVIKGILKTALSLIKGDWQGAWDGIKGIFKSVWEGMKNILPNLIEGIYGVIRGAFSTFQSLGKQAFSAVWDGMKNIWGSISSWVSDKVSWLTDKLAFWRKGNKEMEEDGGSTARVDGSHAKGLSYVPFDGYVAELHKGERVLTAEENSNLGKGGAVSANFADMFRGANFVVRNDDDIDKLAQKLGGVVTQNMRGLGGLA